MGLAFTLWSTALAQPLASFQNWYDGKVFQATQIYPIGTDSAPGILSFIVGGTFLAIIAVAVGTGMYSAGPSAKSTADNLTSLVGLWGLVAGFASLSMLTSGKNGAGHFTPLVGMLLIWVANAVLLVGGLHDVPTVAETEKT